MFSFFYLFFSCAEREKLNKFLKCIENIVVETVNKPGSEKIDNNGHGDEDEISN